MATSTPTKATGLQGILTEAAMLELKAVNAGIEYWQLWMNQAAKLSNIANDTLKAVQEDKGSVSAAARRLTEFGKQNADAFGDLSGRLNKLYFSELGRLAESATRKERKPAARRTAPRKAAGKKKAAAKA